MDILLEQNVGRVVGLNDTGTRQAMAAVGEWTITHADQIESHLAGLVKPDNSEISISLKDIKTLDTSGVWLLLKLSKRWQKDNVRVTFVDVKAEHKILLEAISGAAQEIQAHNVPVPSKVGLLERCLGLISDGVSDVKRILSLLGALMAACARRITGLFLGALGKKPENGQVFRFPALFTHMMKTGLTAVPIICLMTFLIGAIMAQQGAYQLSFFGADVMAVDLVGVLITRDLGVVLTAIMVSGRSGSAYTAEIGSMKMREEIDALKVIGLDPVDVLLFPRILALIIIMPLLTVVANYSALLGAQVALWVYIDLSWELFLQRTRDAIPLTYFMMGIIKAPFMALIIGLIAMSEGLKVEGSSESLSHHTTVAVVKSIFMVIVVDGIFAVISVSLGY
ncbi:MAG: ABC transporter permease [Hyphomicrobiales bacterium]